MEKKYKYEYNKIVQAPIFETVVEGKTFVFKLDRLFEEGNIKQRDPSKRFEKIDPETGKTTSEIHQTFVNRLANGKTESLNLKQFLHLCIFLSERLGRPIQPNDIFEIVEVQEESD